MAAETSKIKAKLAALTSSFDDLEALLEPLFAETLPETLVSLEPLQQAKLTTVLPYIVYDLIFIYLKSRGIDPKTHPVIPELVRMPQPSYQRLTERKKIRAQDRIRQYFEKISNAENPPAKRAEIDKAAAGRFIKHAIAQAQWKKTAAEEMQDEADAPGPSAPRAPGKVTQKMRERAEYEQKIKEEDDTRSADQILEVFEDTDDTTIKMEVDTDDIPSNGKGKSREITSTVENVPATRNKRRRPAVDVFTGLSEDQPSSVAIKKAKSSSPSPPTILETTDASKSGSSTPAIIPEKSKATSKKTKKKSKK